MKTLLIAALVLVGCGAAPAHECGHLGGFKSVTSYGPDCSTISAAITTSGQLLTDSGIVSAEDLAEIRAGVDLWVHSEASMTGPYGEQIDGLARWGTIDLVPNLQGLAHEEMHHVEFSEKWVLDNDHDGWSERGFWGVDHVFQVSRGSHICTRPQWQTTEIQRERLTAAGWPVDEAESDLCRGPME